MKKEYTIFISSEDSISDGNNYGSDKTYTFDWNIIPEGEYEMSFTFLSNTKKVLEAEAEVNTNVMSVEAVVPFSSDRYAAKSSGYSNSSNIIGFVKVEQVDKWTHTGDHFSMRQWVSQVDNPTLRLYGKPQGNEFKIRLLRYSETVAIHSPLEYNMIIKLKHIC
jgi:hypothetical protein